METEQAFGPLTSVWGPVSDVRKVPCRPGHVQVTVADQKLVVQQTTDYALEKIGLLGPPKKKDRFFLIFFEDKRHRRHSVVAGWKNPPDLLPRSLQPLILADDVDLFVAIAQSYPPPAYQDFDIEE